MYISYKSISRVCISYITPILNACNGLAMTEMIMSKGYDCAFSLASMSFGFVLSFVAAHYIRRMKL